MDSGHSFLHPFLAWEVKSELCVCMCMRGDLGGCGCPWDMECEFPGESKKAKKRKEWAEVDERGGVCESGEWGGVTQVAFSPRGPGMPQRLPCPPAVKSVGSRLIPNSTAWRD